MLSMSRDHRDAIVATCVRALPDEGCGLLLGLDARVVEVVGAMNVASSARYYEVDPRAVLAASRRADEIGASIIGSFHSHTHSDAFPSDTDVAQAPDPQWHYVIASLRMSPAVLRSYRIEAGVVDEEEVELLD
jgi:proteasome lid subunit RPN8/RPN11